jgi:hypothetical protein
VLMVESAVASKWPWLTPRLSCKRIIHIVASVVASEASNSGSLDSFSVC